MNSRAHIQQELAQLESNLPYNVKEPVFNVPENYFEQFADRMLAKVRAAGLNNSDPELFELAPTLAGLAKKMPLAVPENYFDTLSNEVPVLMRSEDELPSILLEHARTNPYTVPAGYFENLPALVKGKVQNKPGTKVVLMRTGWLRMAAAAVLTGIIAVGALLSREDVGNANNSASTAVNSGIFKGITAQDLDQFIKTTDAVYTDGTASGTINNAAVADQLLKDVSSKELEAFLAALPPEEDL